jgi:hypothetical protein
MLVCIIVLWWICLNHNGAKPINIYFCNWIECCMVGITIWSINKPIQTNMPCPYWKTFLMPLDSLRFLVLWIYDLITISYHWRMVTKSKQHLGNQSLWEKKICINGGFLPFGLKKRSCRILKSNISDVTRF